MCGKLHVCVWGVGIGGGGGRFACWVVRGRVGGCVSRWLGGWVGGREGEREGGWVARRTQLDGCMECFWWGWALTNAVL